MTDWTLVDLPDDRRAGKALPADDRDVTNGLVVPDYTGLPSCVTHGAMNRIDPLERIYRCQMCGVGARAEAWWDEVCIRVSGEMECEECGRPYWRHPRVTDEVPTLMRACDGRLLKI